MNRPVQVSAPWSTPPIRSSEPVCDIQGFFKLVEQAFNEFCTTQQVPPGSEPVFTHSFPSERLTARNQGAGPDQSFDVITHHVFSSGMAALDNAGTRIPFAPMQMGQIPSPVNDGYNQITYGWTESTQVVFTIWSKSNEVADDLANWFHKFLMKYAHMYKYFQSRGVQHLKYEGRLEDDTQTRESQELQRRRLVYSARLQYLDTYEVPVLREIEIHTIVREPHTREPN